MQNLLRFFAIKTSATLVRRGMILENPQGTVSVGEAILSRLSGKGFPSYSGHVCGVGYVDGEYRRLSAIERFEKRWVSLHAYKSRTQSAN